MTPFANSPTMAFEPGSVPRATSACSQGATGRAGGLVLWPLARTIRHVGRSAPRHAGNFMKAERAAAAHGHGACPQGGKPVEWDRACDYGRKPIQ